MGNQGAPVAYLYCLCVGASPRLTSHPVCTFPSQVRLGGTGVSRLAQHAVDAPCHIPSTTGDKEFMGKVVASSGGQVKALPAHTNRPSAPRTHPHFLLPRLALLPCPPALSPRGAVRLGHRRRRPQRVGAEAQLRGVVAATHARCVPSHRPYLSLSSPYLCPYLWPQLMPGASARPNPPCILPRPPTQWARCIGV